MPVDVAALSSLASDYARSMTSIRRRRVQRLLKREFAGAECVFIVDVGAARAAVLGLSASGAAFCSTDGRGERVSVVKWLHGSTEAVETTFDLLKDSLPVLSTMSLPLADHARECLVQLSRSPAGRSAAAMLRTTIS